MQEHLKEEQVTLKTTVDHGDVGSPITPEQFPVVDQNYKIVELIGHGGMGTVYKAVTAATGSNVAIKVFNTSVSKDKSTLKRFEQEAKALANLDDPELLTIHESGTSPDGAPYLVMEYIEGDNLSEILTREKVDKTRAFSIFIQLCDLLSRAHRRGIIHRDIKPSNIIVTRTKVDLDDNNNVSHERVRVVDFGIARILDSVKEDTTRLTQTGAIFGTPTYMSPEQCQARQSIDQRSDIYSLGCVMYEVLTGHPPFSGDNPLQVAMQHLNDLPKPISLTDCPKNLGRIILQCLAKDPKDRYQSVDDLREDMELVRKNQNPKHLRDPKSAKKRPPSNVVMLFILLSILIIVFRIKSPLDESQGQSASTTETSVSTAGASSPRSAKKLAEIRQLTAEIKLHPQDKFWYMKRAQAYSDIEKFKEAIVDYSKVIELDPQDVHAYTNRGSDYMMTEQYDLAMKDVDKALSLSPNHVNAICTRAIVFKEKKQYGEALTESDRAIKLDPIRPDAYLNRAGVFMKLEKYQDALKEYDKIIQMNPHLAAGYSQRGRCYRELKEYDKSIDDASKAIELEPFDPYLYCNRSYTYMRQNNYQVAQQDVSKALQLDPNNPEAISAQGDCYTGLKEYRLALQEYDKAIAISPGDAYLYESRAYIHSMLRDYDSTIKDCNHALQLNQDLKYAKHLREWCLKYKI